MKTAPFKKQLLWVMHVDWSLQASSVVASFCLEQSMHRHTSAAGRSTHCWHASYLLAVSATGQGASSVCGELALFCVAWSPARASSIRQESPPNEGGLSGGQEVCHARKYALFCDRVNFPEHTAAEQAIGGTRDEALVGELLEIFREQKDPGAWLHEVSVGRMLKATRHWIVGFTCRTQRLAAHSIPWRRPVASLEACGPGASQE